MKKISLLAIIAVWAIVLVFDLNYSLGITITGFLAVLLVFYILSEKGASELKEKEKAIYEEPKVLILQAKKPNSINLTDGKEYVVITISRGKALVRNDKGRKSWYSIKANFIKK